MTLEEIAEIEKLVVSQIEGQNWTDEPLTDQEKVVIGMAVSATIHILSEKKST